MPTKWESAYSVSQRLNVKLRTVYGWARKMGRPGETKITPGQTAEKTLFLRSSLVKRIEKHERTRQRLKGASPRVSAYAASRLLGVHKNTAKARLLARGAKLLPMVQPDGKLGAGFLLKEVEAAKKALEPMAESRCLVSELAELTGWSDKTIRQRLNAAGLETITERSPFSNRRSKTYDQGDALRAIGRKVSDYPAGGDWSTTGHLQRLTGRSMGWLNRRLKRPMLAAARQIRLNDVGRPEAHWPPWVRRALIQESEQSRSTQRQQVAG